MLRRLIAISKSGQSSGGNKNLPTVVTGAPVHFTSCTLSATNCGIGRCFQSALRPDLSFVGGRLHAEVPNTTAKKQLHLNWAGKPLAVEVQPIADPRSTWELKGLFIPGPLQAIRVIILLFVLPFIYRINLDLSSIKLKGLKTIYYTILPPFFSRSFSFLSAAQGSRRNYDFSFSI